MKSNLGPLLAVTLLFGLVMGCILTFGGLACYYVSWAAGLLLLAGAALFIAIAVLETKAALRRERHASTIYQQAQDRIDELNYNWVVPRRGPHNW